MSGLFDTLRRWFVYDAEREFYAKFNPSLVESAELEFRPMRKSDVKSIMAIEEIA